MTSAWGWIEPLFVMVGVPPPWAKTNWEVVNEVIVAFAPKVRLPELRVMAASWVPLKMMGALMVCVPLNTRMEGVCDAPFKVIEPPPPEYS